MCDAAWIKHSKLPFFPEFLYYVSGAFFFKADYINVFYVNKPLFFFIQAGLYILYVYLLVSYIS